METGLRAARSQRKEKKNASVSSRECLCDKRATATAHPPAGEICFPPFASSSVSRRKAMPLLLLLLFNVVAGGRRKCILLQIESSAEQEARLGELIYYHSGTGHMNK